MKGDKHMSAHADPHRVYETLANLVGTREHAMIDIVSIRPKPPDMANDREPDQCRPEEVGA